MYKFLSCVAVAVAVGALFVACKKKEEMPTAETGMTAGTATTAEVALGGDVERGKALFQDTSLGTTGKSCESCHPNGGLEGMSAEGMKTKPLVGVKDRYPGPFPGAPDKGDTTLAGVINLCLTGPLGGEALAEDGQKMKDLLAYLESL
jgi:cytochrome c